MTLSGAYAPASIATCVHWNGSHQAPDHDKVQSWANNVILQEYDVVLTNKIKGKHGCSISHHLPSRYPSNSSPFTNTIVIEVFSTTSDDTLAAIVLDLDTTMALV